MVITRVAVTSTLSAEDLAALRFGSAGLILLPVVWRRGLALDRLGWRGLAMIVVCAGVPYVLLASHGLKLATAAEAGVLTTIPLLAFAAISPFAAGLAREYGMERSLFGALLVIAAGIALRSSGRGMQTNSVSNASAAAPTTE